MFELWLDVAAFCCQCAVCFPIQDVQSTVSGAENKAEREVEGSSCWVICTGVAEFPGLGYAAALNYRQRSAQEDAIFVGYHIIRESTEDNINNNKLQLGCHPVAVVILHVYKI